MVGGQAVVAATDYRATHYDQLDENYKTFSRLTTMFGLSTRVEHPGFKMIELQSGRGQIKSNLLDLSPFAA